jgi:indolepyruvate ferredoxin oxidoreductase
MKGLRGTPFDPIGYMPERRMERRLIKDYRALIEDIVERLNNGNIAVARELAQSAGDIGGYGPVKMASVKQYEAKLPNLRASFDSAAAKSQSQAA